MLHDVHIVLGCWGLTQDSFQLCGGIENVIHSIGPSTPLYNELMDYLDQMKLFDHPMYEWNAITHVIHNLQDKFSPVTKPTWLPKQQERIQRYLTLHRPCGVFIKLRLAESIETVPVPEVKLPSQSFVIPARRTLRLIKK